MPLMESNWEFAQIYTDNDNMSHTIYQDDKIITIKPLDKILGNINGAGLENTIAIDDRIETGNNNPKNIITIKPFNNKPDMELTSMIGRLEIIQKLFDKVGDVRKIKINGSPPVVEC